MFLYRGIYYQSIRDMLCLVLIENSSAVVDEPDILDDLDQHSYNVQEGVHA